MANNKVLEYHSPIQLNVLALITVGPPATAPALDGNPFMLRGTANQAYGGNPVGVALVGISNAVSPTGGWDGFCSFDQWGAYNLSVVAQAAESPVVNSKVVPGDRVYANVNTGTHVTNADGSDLWYGFTVDKNPSGVYFGYVVQGTVASGASGTVTVMLKGDASQ